MTQKKILNIQDNFLNSLRKNKITVKVVLISDDIVKGKITSFDNFVIVLSDEEKDTMIYKHSVSAIIPQGKFRLYGESNNN